MKVIVKPGRTVEYKPDAKSKAETHGPGDDLDVPKELAEKLIAKGTVVAAKDPEAKEIQKVAEERKAETKNEK